MSKRHKQLEETFNLPSLNELDEDDEIEESGLEEPEEDDVNDQIDALEKQLAQYEQYNDISLETTKKYNEDIDTLYNTAKDGYEEIFQAALAMEPAHGAKFLNGAAKLLEIALKSKNSSMEKQIDMAQLQLQREKMYRDGKAKPPQDITDDEGEYETTDYGTGDNGGKIYDRNELMDQMRKRKNDIDHDDT